MLLQLLLPVVCFQRMPLHLLLVHRMEVDLVRPRLMVEAIVVEVVMAVEVVGSVAAINPVVLLLLAIDMAALVAIPPVLDLAQVRRLRRRIHLVDRDRVTRLLRQAHGNEVAAAGSMTTVVTVVEAAVDTLPLPPHVIARDDRARLLVLAPGPVLALVVAAAASVIRSVNHRPQGRIRPQQQSWKRERCRRRVRRRRIRIVIGVGIGTGIVKGNEADHVVGPGRDQGTENQADDDRCKIVAKPPQRLFAPIAYLCIESISQRTYTRKSCFYGAFSRRLEIEMFLQKHCDTRLQRSSEPIQQLHFISPPNFLWLHHVIAA
jgi:hypothetical protein